MSLVVVRMNKCLEYAVGFFTSSKLFLNFVLKLKTVHCNGVSIQVERAFFEILTMVNG